jgi:transcriptional regulator with XRE-family HTH domain
VTGFRSDRLTALRLARGLSQNQLAARSGVNASQVNRYEKGITEPTATRLGQLADALDVTADFLLGRDAFDAEGIERTLVRESLQLFERLEELAPEQREKFERIQQHANAPTTAEQWVNLKEMLEVAEEPTKKKPSLKKTEKGRLHILKPAVPTKGQA